MRPMISITCLNIFMAIKIKIQMVLIMFFTFLLISSNDFGKPSMPLLSIVSYKICKRNANKAVTEIHFL